jgi:hypothetical protein
MSRGVPTAGRFFQLDGLYVSRDGQELLRYPGTALAAEPGYAEKYLGSLAAGASTQFTTKGVSEPHEGYTLIGQAVGTYRPVYIEKANASNDLPEGWYQGIHVTGGKILEVPDSSTGASTVDESAYVTRNADSNEILADDPYVQEIEDCFGRVVIVSETEGYFGVNSGNPPVDVPAGPRKESLAAYVADKALSVVSPLTVKDFSAWPSVPWRKMVTDLRYARLSTQNYETNGDVYNPRALTRKAYTDVYDGRVIVAVPEYGCMFEANVKDHILSSWASGSPSFLTDPGVLDALGIPMAPMHNGNVTEFVTAGGQLSAGDIVYYRFAYRNKKTGAFGLVSPLNTRQVVGATTIALRIPFLIPRWVLRETDADQVILYASEINGSPTALKARVIAIDLDHSVSVPPEQDIDYWDGTADISDPSNSLIPPRLPQMPMGAAWCRNMKGWLFSGGRFGDEDSLDYGVDEVLGREVGPGSFFVDGPFEVSGKGIPPAYTGAHIRQDLGLSGKSSLIGLDEYAQGVPPYQMIWNLASQGTGVTSYKDFPVQHLKGHVQFSPKERPGESASINRVIFDRMEGIDIICAGRFGDYLVLCSDSETYVLAWGRDPSGTDPTLVSTEFGSIGQEMIETDVGLAWLSDRGPVIYDGGGVRWIGKPIADRFNREVPDGLNKFTAMKYLRDSRGFMFHSRGYFDPVERCVHWFLRTDSENTDFASETDDGKKSRTGCDSILTWSVDTGAFSTFEGRTDRKLMCSTRSAFDDGVTRPVVVSGAQKVVNDDTANPVNLDGGVYGVDESFFDRMLEPHSSTVATAPIVSGSDTYVRGLFSYLDVLEWKDEGTTPLAVQPYQAFIRAVNQDRNGKYPLKWWGEVDAIRGITGTEPKELRLVTPAGLPDPSWAVGDTLEVGVMHSELQTLVLDLGDLGLKKKKAHKVTGLVIEHRFERAVNTGSVPIVGYVYAEGWAKGKWTRLHENQVGIPLDVDEDMTRIRQGMVFGRETAVRLTFITNARIRIRDIRLELESLN